jgi:hypothetical protein
MSLKRKRLLVIIDEVSELFGLLKVQTGFFTLKDPGEISLMPDNYKDTKH